MSLREAHLSDRKPASAGTSCDTYRAERHKKKGHRQR